jgi:hypothetical protein
MLDQPTATRARYRLLIMLLGQYVDERSNDATCASNEDRLQPLDAEDRLAPALVFLSL